MANDFILDRYEFLKGYEENSHCNKRHVAALLNLNGRNYVGVNGDEYCSCKEKGLDFCARDKNYGLEFVTCPSLCAEGSAILTALFYGVDSSEWTVKDARAFLENKIADKALSRGILISTGFPCERCTSMIMDTGIGEVYFGQFKNEEHLPDSNVVVRHKDALNIARMGYSNVNLHKMTITRMDRCGKLYYEPKNIQADQDYEFFARKGMRKSAIDYFMELLDPMEREIKKEMIHSVLKNKNPFQSAIPGLVVKPLL
ncbi:MAG: hypothetical protein ABIF85_06795 [Nanoarchaeota archaeon]|nr:hypothetical protein [Nanoarchaeota archaeon]MBU4299942.1 hypothetical protein [Nanoarchaeota archaeon]MBU4452123.1 hypothetical protein [Nanoarchaeota archaeon]MCG2723680.1 hypothetical protein [archaeon]